MPATAGWTVDELWKIPDDEQRREIIDGELFVTPSPAWSHQYVADELAHALRDYLRRHRIAKALTAPADVVFGPRTLVQPDILVVPLVDGRPPRDYREAGQLLVAAEVLSPGTARRDRGVKRSLYQRENVAEYWIVDGDARLIERWRPDDERPEVITAAWSGIPKVSRSRSSWMSRNCSPRPATISCRLFPYPGRESNS